ncbi:hypothetical protein L1887_37977 [Cichorium endivia]|nr:hypothetical protein L1887_37977 [Cichorium endivia]
MVPSPSYDIKKWLWDQHRHNHCTINRPLDRTTTISSARSESLHLIFRSIIDITEVEVNSSQKMLQAAISYAQEGNLSKAMESYRGLGKSSIPIDGFVLSSVMAVFADFALLEQGKQMHAYTTKVPSRLDISVANLVMDMYLKCSSKEDAENVFDEMPKGN